MEENKYIKIVREPSEWFRSNAIHYYYTKGTLELVFPAAAYFCDWSRDRDIKMIVWFIDSGISVDDDLLEAMNLALSVAGEGDVGEEWLIVCWSKIYGSAAEAGETYVRDNEGYNNCVFVGEKVLSGALWVKKD
jgi:hypothetical protein